MKKLSREQQRKLYQMFSASVDSHTSALIALAGISTFSLPTNDEIVLASEKKKSDFLCLLEEGLV